MATAVAAHPTLLLHAVFPAQPVAELCRGIRTSYPDLAGSPVTGNFVPRTPLIGLAEISEMCCSLGLSLSSQSSCSHLSFPGVRWKVLMSSPIPFLEPLRACPPVTLLHSSPILASAFRGLKLTHTH